MAVVLDRDWKYNGKSQDVPSAMRGRMPNVLLVNGRLPSFKDKPGYAFFRGKNTAMVSFTKRSKVIPTVLPLGILTVGVQFRTLAQQTSNQLPAPSMSLTPQFQNAGMALDVKARLQMDCIPMVKGGIGMHIHDVPDPKRTQDHWPRTKCTAPHLRRRQW